MFDLYPRIFSFSFWLSLLLTMFLIENTDVNFGRISVFNEFFFSFFVGEGAGIS